MEAPTDSEKSSNQRETAAKHATYDFVDISSDDEHIVVSGRGTSNISTSSEEDPEFSHCQKVKVQKQKDGGNEGHTSEDDQQAERHATDGDYDDQQTEEHAADGGSDD
ncbi:hypothetical protein ACOSQ3_021355 [Xanthoceras sorbifolium]